MAIRVFYEADNGRSIEFSELSGIRLTALDDISGNTVELSESTVMDQIGSSVSGRSIQAKDLTLEGRYRYSPETRRKLLATILPGVDATLRYVNEREGTDVYWRVSPKQTPVISLHPVWQSFQFVVRVPFPYPRKTDETQYDFMQDKSLFKFPFTYPSKTTFKISERIVNPLIAIENTGDLVSGFMVRMTASADGVKGPYLINVDTQEAIRFSDLTLSNGDILEVCTRTNEKYTHLIHGGETSNIFGAMDYDSVLFRLPTGTSNIRAGASANEGSLATSIYFNELTAGV